MTDHNLASLPTLDLLGMLYSAQANYGNAQSDREREDSPKAEGRNTRSAHHHPQHHRSEHRVRLLSSCWRGAR